MKSARLIHWDNFPLVRLSIPLVLGILLENLQCEVPVVVIGLSIIISLMVLLRLDPKGCLIFSMCCLFGFGLSEFRSQLLMLQADTLNRIRSPYILIANEVSKAERQTKLFGREIRSGAGLQVTLRGIGAVVRPGDTITFKKRPMPAKPSIDSLAFNYNTWLRYKGITYVVQLDQEDVSILPLRTFSLKSRAADLSELISITLAECLPDRQYLERIKAICLGRKEGLAESDRSLFRESGTMHIMAVSGLHVGIISFLINLALGQKGPPTLQWLKWFLLILIIWGFIFITGLRTSAMRAGVMFTLYYSGVRLVRDSVPINSLFGAVFFILCLDPWQLFQVGFQFSITAVLSILTFYPLLEPLIHRLTGIYLKIGQLAVLSLAVQVLLLPISLYYFHSFPVYFLLSNLVAIPLASLTLLLGFLSSLLYLMLPDLARGGGMILQGIHKLADSLLQSIARLPYHVVEDIWPSISTLALYYLAICLLLAGLQLTNTSRFRAGLLALFLTTASYSVDTSVRTAQPRIVFYSHWYRGRIDVTYGRHLFSFSSPKERYLPAYHSYLKGASNSNYDLSIDQNYHGQFGELSFVILNGAVQPSDIPIGSALVIRNFMPTCDFLETARPDVLMAHHPNVESARQMALLCQEMDIQFVEIDPDRFYELNI